MRHVCMHAYLYDLCMLLVYGYIHTYIYYMYVYLSIYLSLSLYLSIYACVCVCVNNVLNVDTHTHTHIDVSVYLSTESWIDPSFLFSIHKLSLARSVCPLMHMHDSHVYMSIHHPYSDRQTVY